MLRSKSVAAALMASTILVAAPIAIDSYRAESAAFAAQHAASTDQALPISFAELVKHAKPAVVTVEVKGDVTADEGFPGQMPPQFGHGNGSPFDDFFNRFFGNPNGEGPGQMMPSPQPHEQMHGLGSGFIIDPSGIIVTNNHVVDHSSDIRVTLDDGTELPATVLGQDEKTDLAVIKVKADHPLPTVTWGDSDEAKLGDWVVAIGNPFGLGGTVTAGIVSARGRDLHNGPYDDFLQIDAPINRGNSGGPLLDTEGNVIGVNAAIYSPNGGSVGVGFAIPSNLARDIVAKLETEGHVERGFLGVSIQPLTADIADALGLEPDSGALVAEVTANSPAASAGIEAGDVITKFAGKPIKSPHELSAAVADIKAGTREPVEVNRNGKTQTIEAVIAEMPNEQHVAVDQSAGGSQETGKLGFALTDLTPDLRQRLNLSEDEQGAVVADVVPGKAAADAGIQDGDLIVAVGSHHVANARDAIDAVREAEETGHGKVLLLVEHQGHRMFVSLDSQVG